MSRRFSRSSLALVVALVLLACALRVYRLGVSPFRGDEAFAVRYWADSPTGVLSGLAWQEPHPFGAFFGFWAWKSLVGSSEFAMRMLPVLANLLGIPAMIALGRRLLHDERAALFGALLWAVNPNQIWHAQDVRNYAVWAGLSVVTFWLLLRASDSNRRVDWVLYVVSAVLTLYLFFTEVFIVAVHGLYVLLCRRRALRAWFGSIGIASVLLLPWFGQLWALLHSGYRGTAAGANLGDLVARFWPWLAFGQLVTDQVSSWLLLGGFLLFCAGSAVFVRKQPRAGITVLLWLGVPAVLLFAAATRSSIFLPDYLLAVTPAIILPVAWLLAALTRRPHRPVRPLFSTVVSVAFVGLTIYGLAAYYSPAYRKTGTDWFGLRDYLAARTTSDDTVIMTSLDPQTGYLDPAFEYYYPGPATVISLPRPAIDINQAVRQALIGSRAVWFVVVGENTGPINEALLAEGMLITDERAGQTTQVRQYRDRAVKPSEVETPLHLSAGGGSLYGYSQIGEARTGNLVTVLLFWDRPPDAGLAAFVHLLGSVKPDGSPLWTQDDHPPSAPGRDVYHLDLSAVPAGAYTIEIGLYDPKTSQRKPIIDSDTGKAHGDSTVIGSLKVQ